MPAEPTQQVGATSAKHSKAASQQPAPVHFGRNVDDGGSDQPVILKACLSASPVKVFVSGSVPGSKAEAQEP